MEMPYDSSDENEEINWQHEAEAVMKDIGFAVKYISIAKTLPCTPSEVYLNIETKESEKLCVQLSLKGFKVVAGCFDDIKEDYPDSVFYETSYALLNKYSVEFSHCFAKELQSRLEALAES